MSGPAFFQTRMGQRFFEVTMPKIADQLESLNTTLRAIADALQASNTGPAPASASAPPAITTAGSDAAWKAKLLEIAAKHLRIDSFEELRVDRLDFREVHVKDVGAALRDAYRAGIAAGSAHLRPLASVSPRSESSDPG